MICCHKIVIQTSSPRQSDLTNFAPFTGAVKFFNTQMAGNFPLSEGSVSFVRIRCLNLAIYIYICETCPSFCENSPEFSMVFLTRFFPAAFVSPILYWYSWNLRLLPIGFLCENLLCHIPAVSWHLSIYMSYYSGQLQPRREIINFLSSRHRLSHNNNPHGKNRFFLEMASGVISRNAFDIMDGKLTFSCNIRKE